MKTILSWGGFDDFHSGYPWRMLLIGLGAREV